MATALKLVKLSGLFILLFGFTIKLMQWFGVGCASSLCRQNGVPYGLQLALAFVLLGLIGATYQALVSCKSLKATSQQPFTTVAIGLTVLLAYIYARSLLNHLVISMPITRWEVLALLSLGLVAAWAQSARRQAQDTLPSFDHTMLVASLAILIALCFLFADRELPRLLSLSSDPDQHAYFSKQIARFGAIPHEQGAWGPQPFNYPAGSGTLLYTLTLLVGIQALDGLVTLPVLLTFVSALIVVEQLALNLKPTSLKVILQLGAVALVAAGLMFPLYSEYLHGEGSARIMSMVFSALMLVVLAPELKNPRPPALSALALISLGFFALMVLSPANALMPAVMIAAVIVYGLLNRHNKLRLMWVPLGAISIALLDPYYQRLAGLTQSVSGEGIIMAQRFELLQLHDIWTLTLQFYFEKSDQFLSNMAVLLVEPDSYLFAIMIAVLGTILLVLPPRPAITAKGLLATTSFLVILFLVYGFSFAFENDRRFYLLGPYFFFNISQYKALLLIGASTLILMKTMVLKRPLIGPAAAIGLAVGLTWSAQLLIRSNQEIFLDPRRSLCGALGCVEQDDLKLLKAFETLTASGALARPDGHTSRVLTPNAFTNSEIESWIFPVTSARLLPQFDVLPAAFYYYQGEPDYGTASYDTHVCQKFDRPWLASLRIDYLFLPSEREAACIFGMDDLIRSEKVILKEGNAYLLQLQTPN